MLVLVSTFVYLCICIFICVTDRVAIGNPGSKLDFKEGASSEIFGLPGQ